MAAFHVSFYRLEVMGQQSSIETAQSAWSLEGCEDWWGLVSLTCEGSRLAPVTKASPDLSVRGRAGWDRLSPPVWWVKDASTWTYRRLDISEGSP